QHRLLADGGGCLVLRNQPFLNSPSQARPAVILVAIWQGLGRKAMIYLASLQTLDQQLYEAAEIDGASAVQRFRHITVPILAPTTFFILVTSIIGNFQTFDLIYALTSAAPAHSTT